MSTPNYFGNFSLKDTDSLLWYFWNLTCIISTFYQVSLMSVPFIFVLERSTEHGLSQIIWNWTWVILAFEYSLMFWKVLLFQHGDEPVTHGPWCLRSQAWCWQHGHALGVRSPGSPASSMALGGSLAPCPLASVGLQRSVSKIPWGTSGDETSQL